MECYAPGEAVGQTAYSSIVGLLAERIEYETPLQKSYMHQGYSFNYLVNEDGLCFMVSGRAAVFSLVARLALTVKKNPPGRGQGGLSDAHLLCILGAGGE